MTVLPNIFILLYSQIEKLLLTYTPNTPMFTPLLRRPASGLDAIDSIPRLLFYTWFSLFTALAIMGAYLAWFSVERDAEEHVVRSPITEGLKSAASVYDYVKVRPHQRRMKKPTSNFKNAAPAPCVPEAPLP